MNNIHHDTRLDRLKGSLLGLASGDAVGTTVEFKPRGTFKPITDMVGGGPFRLDPGQWTDDTSMALCLGHSLAYRKTFDPKDQMNRYCNWYQHGYMSSNGKCFDIGNTISSALLSYLNTKEPFSGSTDKMSSGNGSIMRLSPIVIFYHNEQDQCLHYAGESSRTTHGSVECVEACKIFARLILNALDSKNKHEALDRSIYQTNSAKLECIFNQEFLNLKYEELTGSGYVVESLISALWCFFNSNTFEEAILLATNIGNDADTTAAIAGQIAGAYYGKEGIPKHWLAMLTMSDEIEALAVELYNQK